LANVRGELPLRSTVLPVPPLPVSQAKVVALRKRLKMSQSVFAAVLNVPTKLVRNWETGLRSPDRGELRLLEVLARQPEMVTKLILANGPRERPKKKTEQAKRASRRKETSVA
jgi:DNA-binding transcriptional regulator YiaG